MEKLIKITAKMINGSIRKFRTTSFSVKSFRDGSGLYVKLFDDDGGITFTCSDIKIEQKEIESILSPNLNEPILNTVANLINK